MKNEDLYVYKKSDFYEDYISSQKEYYEREQVDTLLAEKDKEIALLKERICNGDVSRATWIDDCIAKDKEIAELKDKVKFCSDFELAARKEIKEMRGQHQMLKQFGHYKLSPVPGHMIKHETRQYVSYNVVCMIINHLESETKKLKQKLESVQASMYCDVVDANMEVRRLRRALWLARAKRALEKIAWFKLWNASISTMNPEDGARQEFDKWKKSLGKCLKKAEEYGEGK